MNTLSSEDWTEKELEKLKQNPIYQKIWHEFIEDMFVIGPKTAGDLMTKKLDKQLKELNNGEETYNSGI